MISIVRNSTAQSTQHTNELLMPSYNANLTIMLCCIISDGSSRKGRLHWQRNYFSVFRDGETLRNSKWRPYDHIDRASRHRRTAHNPLCCVSVWRFQRHGVLYRERHNLNSDTAWPGFHARIPRASQHRRTAYNRRSCFSVWMFRQHGALYRERRRVSLALYDRPQTQEHRDLVQRDNAQSQCVSFRTL